MSRDQLALADKKDVIETIIIQPTKEMPKEVFVELWRLSYFMELMDRIDGNHVIWDENVTSIMSETSAEVEYECLQNDWFSMTMEIPKVVYDQIKPMEAE